MKEARVGQLGLLNLLSTASDSQVEDLDHTLSPVWSYFTCTAGRYCLLPCTPGMDLLPHKFNFNFLQIRMNLTPIEIMSSLIAAVTHDLDHPGVNQPFLIATSNHLAALYEVSIICKFLLF